MFAGTIASVGEAAAAGNQEAGLTKSTTTVSPTAWMPTSSAELWPAR